MGSPEYPPEIPADNSIGQFENKNKTFSRPVFKKRVDRQVSRRNIRRQGPTAGIPPEYSAGKRLVFSSGIMATCFVHQLDVDYHINSVTINNIIRRKI